MSSGLLSATRPFGGAKLFSALATFRKPKSSRSTGAAATQRQPTVGKQRAHTHNSDSSETDEAEMHGNDLVAAARTRERQRCAAIMATPQAADNLAVAANLAFKTTLSRKEAISTLRNLSAVTSPGAIDQRSAEMWDRAFKDAAVKRSGGQCGATWDKFMKGTK